MSFVGKWAVENIGGACSESGRVISMARYEIYHDDKGLSFGHDHVCGEYLQIWTRPDDPGERKQQDEFGPDELVVDEDNMTVFTRERMLELIKEHGFELSELKAKAEGR